MTSRIPATRGGACTQAGSSSYIQEMDATTSSGLSAVWAGNFGGRLPGSANGFPIKRRSAPEGEAVGERTREPGFEDLGLRLLHPVRYAVHRDGVRVAVEGREGGERIAVARLADGPGVDEIACTRTQLEA